MSAKDKLKLVEYDKKRIDEIKRFIENREPLSEP